MHVYELKEIYTGAIYYQNSIFGDGTLPILAQSFSCSGTENSLLSCGGTIGYSTCYHGRTAGVRCFSEYNYNNAMGIVHTFTNKQSHY